MARMKALLRLTSSVCLGVWVTLIVFGLALALLWTLAPDSPSSKLVTALLSAAIALGVGGFGVAWLARVSDLALPAGFGFLFAGLSSAYILGPDGLVLILASAGALIAAAGGRRALVTR
jgi:hypothetical protein